MPAMHSVNYEPTEQFAVIPLYGGKPPANAIAHGSLSAIIDSKARADDLAQLKQLKNDSVGLRNQANEIAELLRAQSARDNEMEKVRSTLTDVLKTVDAVGKRVAALEERKRADDAARDAEPLPRPPGEPKEDDYQPPAGGLHANEPKGEGGLVEDEDEPELPAPPGDAAELLPASSGPGFDDPLAASEEPEPKERGKAFPQPVGVSFHSQ